MELGSNKTFLHLIIHKDSFCFWINFYSGCLVISDYSFVRWIKHWHYKNGKLI